MNKEPSIRQRKALAGILAGKTKKQALLEAGYSKHVSETPSLVTSQKSFQALLKEAFPDEYIIDKQKSLMEAKRTTSIFCSQADTKKDKKQIEAMIEGAGGQVVGTRKMMGGLLVFIVQPDHDAQNKAYDMLMKLRGLYASQKVEMVRPYQDMTDEELDAAIEEAKKQFKKG